MGISSSYEKVIDEERYATLNEMRRTHLIGRVSKLTGKGPTLQEAFNALYHVAKNKGLTIRKCENGKRHCGKINVTIPKGCCWTKIFIAYSPVFYFYSTDTEEYKCILYY